LRWRIVLSCHRAALARPRRISKIGHRPWVGQTCRTRDGVRCTTWPCCRSSPSIREFRTSISCRPSTGRRIPPPRGCRCYVPPRRWGGISRGARRRTTTKKMRIHQIFGRRPSLSKRRGRTRRVPGRLRDDAHPRRGACWRRRASLARVSYCRRQSCSRGRGHPPPAVAPWRAVVRGGVPPATSIRRPRRRPRWGWGAAFVVA